MRVQLRPRPRWFRPKACGRADPLRTKISRSSRLARIRAHQRRGRRSQPARLCRRHRIFTEHLAEIKTGSLFWIGSSVSMGPRWKNSGDGVNKRTFYGLLVLPGWPRPVPTVFLASCGAFQRTPEVAHPHGGCCRESDGCVRRGRTCVQSSEKDRCGVIHGATAELTQQIENGAPFDVFAAADTEHIEFSLLRRSWRQTPRPFMQTGNSPCRLRRRTERNSGSDHPSRYRNSLHSRRSAKVGALRSSRG